MTLTYRTDKHLTIVRLSADKKRVTICSGNPNVEWTTEVANFRIEDLWDMLRDTVATIDAGPIKEPGLFRRKGEAAAGILYTNKQYGKVKGEKENES